LEPQTPVWKNHVWEVKEKNKKLIIIISYMYQKSLQNILGSLCSDILALTCLLLLCDMCHG